MEHYKLIVFRGGGYCYADLVLGEYNCCFFENLRVQLSCEFLLVCNTVGHSNGMAHHVMVIIAFLCCRLSKVNVQKERDYQVIHTV